MRILVDRDRCEANQACMRVAPQVFRVDEADRLHVLVERVDPALRPQVERAVKACPRRALTLADTPDEG